MFLRSWHKMKKNPKYPIYLVIFRAQIQALTLKARSLKIESRYQRTDSRYMEQCAARGCTLQCCVRSTNTVAEIWLLPHFRRSTVKPRVDFRRVASSCLPELPFGYKNPLVEQNRGRRKVFRTCSVVFSSQCSFFLSFFFLLFCRSCNREESDSQDRRENSCNGG